MFFYEVIPASSKYSGRDTLRYRCDKDLKVGQVVSIKFRNFDCYGIISSKGEKPSFKTQDILKQFQGMILPQSSMQLLEWMREYYPGPLGQTAQLFIPSILSPKTKDNEQAPKLTLNNKLPDLTAEQKNVLQQITTKKERNFLLHGITGSGKTRVYIELAKKCLQSNKSAIVLTPEISLTPQLVKSFQEVFGNKVLLTHSGLTPSQRATVWRKCLTEDSPKIILGPRSAIFAPIGNVGLIVVDEAHDSAYKQDKTPFYHTLRVGGYLSSCSGAKVVMGSATPNISEYFIAKSKKVPILKMNNQAISTKSKVITKIVDMTDKDNLGRYPLLSKPLVEALSANLDKGLQSIVFINKRGDAKSIVCQNCGWQAKCNDCDLPLTYHADNNRFSCHTCGKHYPARTTCQDCKSTDIILKSPGTKALTTYLSKLFPSARVARFDTDNKKAERIDTRHSELTKGDIDILVGTQLLTKGHDLTNLGLVAMLIAESGLSFPDYTAEERTFQTLRQLSGRVGRGHQDGKIIIQSFNPKSPLLDQAINGDYDSFYQSQIDERKSYGFPPFYHVMKISSPRASSASSLSSAEKIKATISANHPRCVILGPSPAFYFKKAGKYNWQIVIKAKTRSTLTNIINDLPSNHTANIDPLNLL